MKIIMLITYSNIEWEASKNENVIFDYKKNDFQNNNSSDNAFKNTRKISTTNILISLTTFGPKLKILKNLN